MSRRIKHEQWTNYEHTHLPAQTSTNPKSPHNTHNRNHLTQHLYDAQQRWLKFTNIILWVISFSVHLQLMRFVQGGRSLSIISLDDSVIIITKVCAYV